MSGNCAICGEWKMFDSHRCLPLFQVIDVDGCYGEDDPWQWAHEVRARDAESAAEKFADSYDSEGDYTIIRGSPATFDVRDARGQITRWEVHGESVPSYTAYATPTPETPNAK